MTRTDPRSADDWRTAFGPVPLIAILRGLEPESAIDTAAVLISAGIRTIEVPLNSPRPIATIARLVERFGDEALLGAGTVLTADEARAVIDTGARLIVAPNIDAEVASIARGHGAVYCPGAMTPTEVFSALTLGATAVKLFPAEIIGPAGVKAMRAVVPPGTALFPVGGISPSNLADYVAAGADGFGLGSALFKPGMSPADVEDRARAFLAAWQSPIDTSRNDTSRNKS